MDDGVTDSLSAQQQADLMALVAHSRDREAFVKLFRHFAPRLMSYMRKLGTDNNITEGLVQDVMLTLWRQAESYDPEKSYVSSWVFAIARNRRIDRYRRQRLVPVDQDYLQGQLHLHSQIDESPSQDQDIEHQEVESLLKEAIESLPHDQASLLELAFYQDMTHMEIAKHEGLPLGTVKSRLRLAISKLRRILGSSI
ncbi:sigma-70 family RNA polymerase sigma factor [Kiloniella majae]|uniref:sigma-70 family RNA polymerase sigma factor n=1 Tax=Kiloniella majae TaxID=1938558 RepID=UPI000A276E1A|nr:sigma-70 family RNA polymerase sigma factor [Kiloniella majae]